MLFLARFRRCRHGVIAVEFALLLPLMLVMLLGSFTAANLARASMKMWNVAQSMADLVAQQTTVTTTQIADFCTGATITLAPVKGTMQASIASVTMSAAGVRAVDWQDTTCGGGSTIANALTLGAAYTPSAQDSVIVVRVTYSYVLPASYVLPQSFTFTRTTYSRPRSGTQVSHG